MGALPSAVRSFLLTGPLAHVVTLGGDGSPHVTVAWVGLEGDDVVIGTLVDQPKLRNVRRDARVALSFETDVQTPIGLLEYLVLHGRGEVTEGGAPELLQRLAKTYLGPDVRFPSMPNPPPGYVLRVIVDRIAGIGPWAEGEG